ncbi:MAG: leucine-rich repeat domain-containing protein [Spirochaetales bacterium]|nr:leucine-rich repeat domain-containing protein [Spirochaetales bacterium]
MEDGEIRYTCTKCGKTKSGETVPAIGHHEDLPDEWEVELRSGSLIQLKRCPVCHAEFPFGWENAELFDVLDGALSVVGELPTDVMIPTIIGGKVVTKIGNEAFKDETELTSVEIPLSVTCIGEEAFYGCSSLEQIEIPHSVKEIDDSAFYECENLSSVVFEGTPEVQRIGDLAFSVCPNLSSFTVPASVRVIGYGVFGWSGVETLEIESGIETFTNGCFSNMKQLTSVTIPSSVTSIEGSAFWGCDSLGSVVIPSSVTSIGNYAFSECDALLTATIPYSVTSIGYQAFKPSAPLEQVYYTGEEDQWNAINNHWTAIYKFGQNNIVLTTDEVFPTYCNYSFESEVPLT